MLKYLTSTIVEDCSNGSSSIGIALPVAQELGGQFLGDGSPDGRALPVVAAAAVVIGVVVATILACEDGGGI